MPWNPSSRCAACKSLRRKCPKDCVLAPYFPSTDPERYAFVHRIYGASNITKMLQNLPVYLREKAAETMAIEAKLRVEDPVYGCVGVVHHLQQQIIEAQSEIRKTKCEIAFYSAQELQQRQHHPPPQPVFHGEEEPPWLDPSHRNFTYQQFHC